MTKKYFIIPARKNAKYVFHSSSTTSFESLLSDVMPINLKFLENPFKIELVENISFNCNSIQDLKEIIENKKDNELNLKLHESKNIVDRLIHNYGSSSRTIAENINICLEESRDINFMVLEKYNIIKSNWIINLLKNILYFLEYLKIFHLGNLNLNIKYGKIVLSILMKILFIADLTKWVLRSMDLSLKKCEEVCIS